MREYIKDESIITITLFIIALNPFAPSSALQVFRLYSIQSMWRITHYPATTPDASNIPAIPSRKMSPYPCRAQVIAIGTYTFATLSTPPAPLHPHILTSTVSTFTIQFDVLIAIWRDIVGTQRVRERERVRQRTPQLTARTTHCG